jgi:hypothetical protein
MLVGFCLASLLLAQADPESAPPLLEAPPPVVERTPPLVEASLPPPPVVQAPPTPPIEPPPRAVPAATPPAPPPADETPLVQVRALATASLGLPFNLTGSGLLVGGRAELDVWRLQARLVWDRAGTTPFTIASTDFFTGTVGYSLFSSSWAKLRVLGGVASQSGPEAPTHVGPVVGLSGRLGLSFLALEGSATLSPLGLPSFDAQVALVLRGGFFELHAGWRTRYVDPSGSLATLFTTTPVAGPSVGVGLAF